MTPDENPDDVGARYRRKKTNISIRQLDSETILIEAPAAGLKYLGEVLLAQAEFTKDCGWQLDKGAKVFDASSEKGVYIHRLPCMNDKAPAPKKPRRKTQLRSIK